jgi:hypothetical protein
MLKFNIYLAFFSKIYKHFIHNVYIVTKYKIYNIYKKKCSQGERADIKKNMFWLINFLKIYKSIQIL